MTSRTLRRFARCLLLSAVIALLASPTHAARPESGVRKLTSKHPLVQWVLVALFTTGSLAIAFKNSKRTHLD